MIDHIELSTSRLTEAVAFYSAVLAPLGYKLQVDGAAKGFGDGRTLDFFLKQGEPSTHIHYAFQCSSRTLVDDIYQLAGLNGFTLDRAPALAANIHPNYYAGYLRDPDGHLVEFVCHKKI